MAEKEGFEPSIPFWGIHDFQSCALGQLRDFSIARFSPLEYITLFGSICQGYISSFCKNDVHFFPRHQNAVLLI